MEWRMIRCFGNEWKEKERKTERRLGTLKNIKGGTMKITRWDARERTTWGDATARGRGRTRQGETTTHLASSFGSTSSLIRVSCS